jgi:phage terminase small subunit
MARLKGSKGKPKPTPLDGFIEEIGEDEFKGWTHRHKLFALAYLRHSVGSRAMREAGYKVSIENQRGAAHALLKLPHIAKFIAERRAEQLERLGAGADRVLEELAAIAFSSPMELFEVVENEGTPGRMTLKAAIEHADPRVLAGIKKIKIEDMIVGDLTIGQKIEVEMHNKTGALDTLAKHHKLVGADVDVNVGFDIGDRLADAKRKLREARAAEEGNGDAET